MANDSPEQDFLDKLLIKCNDIDGWKVHTNKCRYTPYMDFEATITLNTSLLYIKCESKVASKIDVDGNIDTNYGDKHNANHKIFGEIIKGRNISDCVNHQMEKVYGLIIPQRDYLFFKNKYITMLDDWNLFGITFNAKYVFVFDEMNNSLKIYSWSKIWSDNSPIFTY